MSQRFMPVSQSLPEERSEMLPPALALLNAITAPVFVQDAKCRWLHVNEACCTLLGQSAATLLGANDRVFSPVTLAELAQTRQTVLRTGTPIEQEVTWVASQGQRQIAKAHITRLDQSDRPLLVTTLRPVSQSAAADQQLQQSRLRQLNAELERQVEQRTQQLKQALEFEATLKRITDRVRDSLDETQILQTAVQEVSQALGAKGANTALYNLEQGTSTIYYEHNESLPSYQGRVAQMEAFPEVYHQLLDGQYFQFCSQQPNPVRGHVSMLACPILDDRGVLGDLWLINGSEHGFQEPEIRLVQQVANQCAIAIRQARLYQAAQSQVKELERLNQLKDDFLSTVSHELRTPVTSMRVALQLLGVTLNQEFDLNAELQKPQAERSRIARYYQVLKEECEREISLINDLLDLQRLDGGNHPIHAQPIDITTWLPSLVSGFQERTQSRQQTLNFQVEAALPKLVSDSASLDRVFAELLNNACKYTPPGESITLSVKQAPSQQLCFQVINSGVEIPPDELPRIFDKFYRVPSADPWKQGGTGLGLALVQKLLWHMGGEINVTSADQQTCFTVMLPVNINQGDGL
ncbi:MAG: ATP-binding protein [Leptolyngbyaceae cyanobacterium]